MDDTEFIEAFLALYGFCVLFIFIGIGAVLNSLLENLYFLYVDYEPQEDVVVIGFVLIANFIMISYLLNNALKFRKSRNLNYHLGELTLAMDKMKIYSLIVFLPIQAILIFYNMKYFDTSISIPLLLQILCNFSLFILIFYAAFDFKRTLEQQQEDQFNYEEPEPL